MDKTVIILAEIDTNSHVSIISEKYFETNLKKDFPAERFLNEENPRFTGIGGDGIIPNTRPLDWTSRWVLVHCREDS